MRKNKPLVSVVMTAYNAERYVYDAVKSILNQDYLNIELIVVNDGSTDGTLKILKDLRGSDNRIKIIDLEDNIGASLASNYGVMRARGRFLAKMDADDISFSDRISKQVSYLISNPDVVVVGGQCDLINEEGDMVGEKKFPVDHGLIYKALFKRNPIQHPSCMISLGLVSKDEIVGDNYGLLAHDLDLLFKLSEKGKLVNLDEKILKYRQFDKSMSLRNPRKTFWDTVLIRHRAVKKYGYKPGLSGWLIHFGQILVIFFLPKRLVFPLYSFIRGFKRKVINFRFSLNYEISK